MVNLKNVYRSKDGKLVADGYMLSTCDHCDSLHFEFKDEKGDVFAVALIPSEALLELSACIAEAAADFEKRGKLPARQ